MTNFKKKFTRKVSICGHEYMLGLNPGYTAIIGSDTNARTELLESIRKLAVKEKCDILYRDMRNCFKYDVDTRTLWKVIEKQVLRACDTDKPLFVILDTPDINLTVKQANEMTLKIRELEQELGMKADGSADHPVYILAAVDNFELVYSKNIDATHGDYHIFWNYREYRQWLLNS